MPDWLLWGVVVWLHVLAAITWVGGMIFIAAVLAPVWRGLEPPLRQRLTQSVGPAARSLSWFAIVLLVMTGILNVIHLHPSWDSLTGRLLAAKLTLVAVVLMVSAAHDFWLGPRLSSMRQAGAITEATPLARAVPLIARVNLALALAIVFLAVLLARS